MPMTTGSYWVYQVFRYNASAGDTTLYAELDSCYIAGDSIVDGISYHVFIEPSATGDSIHLLRDSIHYILDGHERVFSSAAYPETLNSGFGFGFGTDTVNYFTTVTTEIESPFHVPAGTFTTTNAKTTYNMYAPYDYAAAVRIKNCRYAENVGIVQWTLPYYFSSANTETRVLLRYHIN
jgi:hypothetical protein